MSDDRMPKDVRLVRRKVGKYSFRAHVPEDVRDFIPGGGSGQKWIALGTSDPAEATRRVRIKSVEFDQTVEASRKRKAGVHSILSDADIGLLPV